MTGDIIQVGYLDTTLWEFGGPYLKTRNHPSGLIIKFPVVDPRRAGSVKTRLIPALLNELNKEPDRVLFPKSNMR